MRTTLFSVLTMQTDGEYNYAARLFIVSSGFRLRKLLRGVINDSTRYANISFRVSNFVPTSFEGFDSARFCTRYRVKLTVYKDPREIGKMLLAGVLNLFEEHFEFAYPKVTPN